MLVELVPNLSAVGPSSTAFDRCLLQVGQARPRFGQIRETSTGAGPSWARIGPQSELWDGPRSGTRVEQRNIGGWVRIVPTCAVGETVQVLSGRSRGACVFRPPSLQDVDQVVSPDPVLRDFPASPKSELEGTCPGVTHKDLCRMSVAWIVHSPSEVWAAGNSSGYGRPRLGFRAMIRFSSAHFSREALNSRTRPDPADVVGTSNIGFTTNIGAEMSSKSEP